MNTRPRLDELPDVLTAHQVAAYLGLTPHSVYEALRRRELPSLRVGRRLLIPKAELMRRLADSSSNDMGLPELGVEKHHGHK